MNTLPRTPLVPRRRARLTTVAAACALLGASPAWADAVVTGSVATVPASSFAGGVGVGPFDFPSNDLYVGFNGLNGSLTLNGGTQASFRSVTTAGVGGQTTVALPDFNVLRVQDANTKLSVQGVATGWGSGDIYVTNEGFIDGRSTACADKSFNFFFCGTSIGSTAGSLSSLEVDGAGSLYQTRSFVIARTQVAPVSSGGGTPGGSVGASAEALNGGTIRSWNVTVGQRFSTAAPATGTETATAIMRINGANSLWVVDGYNSATDGPTVLPNGTTVLSQANTAPSIQAGTFAGGTGEIYVENGGTLRIERADPLSAAPFVNIGAGGTGKMRVTGVGSKVEFQAGLGGVLQVGRRAGGTGTLDVDGGGLVTGLQYLSVGRAQFSSNVLDSGGSGTMVVDGAGSIVRLNDFSTSATTSSVGQLDIGRGAGSTGTVTVRNGGRIEILGSVARPGGLTTYNGPTLLVGREAGDAGAPTTFTGSGILNIQGVGSVVELRADAAANGVNPSVRIGRTGTGSGNLNVSAGGKLVIEGNAASTLASFKPSSFIVGGSGGFSPATLAGGIGNVLLSGAGSEILMTGNDLFASLGDGPGGAGQMTISNGGKFTGTLFQVGRVRTTGNGDSASGTLTLNGGQMALSGEFNSTVSDSVVGANMTIGTDAGSVGSVSMNNSSTLQITNTVLDRNASLNIGGNASVGGGTGSLVMASGSSVSIDGRSGSFLNVGVEGTGSLTMNDSSITLAANGQANINGSAQLANGSSLNAGSFLGIAASGGTGTLLINNSTVTATDVVIGAGGFLGGSGATVVGNLTNFGIFSPGASPGTFTIQGNYKAEAGSKLILEVESDGSGGFRTDKVIFGGTVDLNGLDVEFKFLGDTNPNAFAGSGGFEIDTFLQKEGGGGLGDAAFAGVDFSASAAPSYALNNFRFDAATGSNLAPVPEPGTWALMLGGLGALGWARRTKARA